MDSIPLDFHGETVMYDVYCYSGGKVVDVIGCKSYTEALMTAAREEQRGDVVTEIKPSSK